MLFPLPICVSVCVRVCVVEVESAFSFSLELIKEEKKKKKKKKKKREMAGEFCAPFRVHRMQWKPGLVFLLVAVLFVVGLLCLSTGGLTSRTPASCPSPASEEEALSSPCTLSSPLQSEPAAAAMADGAVILMHGLGDQGSSWASLEHSVRM